ncbi:MAG TPA: helix-turn-helix domain-containing protein [Desulfosarcina sp.]|nr:helix-turn-helix domain-containing protein [Desulfosarcina sp.]
MVTIQITNLLTDDAVLAELGRRLAQRRINSLLTQADLAREAGVSKRTVERIEAGASAQMASLIRIFRVLDLMPALYAFIPQAGPRPMDLVKAGGKNRKRVSPASKGSGSDEPWTWNE